LNQCPTRHAICSVRAIRSGVCFVALLTRQSGVALLALHALLVQLVKVSLDLHRWLLLTMRTLPVPLWTPALITAGVAVCAMATPEIVPVVVEVEVAVPRSRPA
jgi:hypothetical protein